MRLLTVNTGSSSVRLALYAGEGENLRLLAERYHDGQTGSQDQAGQTLSNFIGGQPVDAVAHRVVHGGEKLTVPRVIDAGIEEEIERLIPLAPLHNPRALGWVRACRALLGNRIVQVAVFDTGFYATLPAVACSYALPQQLVRRLGLRRYGFHGIAHQAMWRRWHHLTHDDVVGGRVISLQLGAGCSITAISNGLPQDTSMGFSPLEGLVMATRSGDLDPGMMLHLLRTEKISIDELDQLLNRESGLYGMSGESDMRKLLHSDDPAAQLAIELYCYRARKYIGAYLTVLGGADAILFGGGVGEHAPEIRERILASMEWAGIALDRQRNRDAVGAEACISKKDSPVAVWTIAVDEAKQIAEETLNLLNNR